MPPWQKGGLFVHGFPHLPQLNGSFCTYTHWSPQHSNGTAQFCGVHAPVPLDVLPVDVLVLVDVLVDVDVLVLVPLDVPVEPDPPVLAPPPDPCVVEPHAPTTTPKPIAAAPERMSHVLMT